MTDYCIFQHLGLTHPRCRPSVTERRLVTNADRVLDTTRIEVSAFHVGGSVRRPRTAIKSSPPWIEIQMCAYPKRSFQPSLLSVLMSQHAGIILHGPIVTRKGLSQHMRIAAKPEVWTGLVVGYYARMIAQNKTCPSNETCSSAKCSEDLHLAD